MGQLSVSLLLTDAAAHHVAAGWTLPVCRSAQQADQTSEQETTWFTTIMEEEEQPAVIGSGPLVTWPSATNCFHSKQGDTSFFSNYFWNDWSSNQLLIITTITIIALICKALFTKGSWTEIIRDEDQRQWGRILVQRQQRPGLSRFPRRTRVHVWFTLILFIVLRRWRRRTWTPRSCASSEPCWAPTWDHSDPLEKPVL